MGTIIYLAALAGINPDLYEASEIDGAGDGARRSALPCRRASRDNDPVPAQNRGLHGLWV